MLNEKKIGDTESNNSLYPYIQIFNIETKEKLISFLVIKNFMQTITKNINYKKKILIEKILSEKNKNFNKFIEKTTDNFKIDKIDNFFNNEIHKNSKGLTKIRLISSHKKQEDEFSKINSCNPFENDEKEKEEEKENKYKDNNQLDPQAKFKISTFTNSITNTNTKTNTRLNLIKQKFKKNLKNFFKKITLQKNILILYIKNSRENSSNKIKNYFRMYSKRKQVLKIINKNNNCHLIKCKIQHALNVELKVLFKDKTYKSFDFHLCPIRKVFILYIDKCLIKEKRYKVNFIADGNTIIDPLYKSDYDHEGNFHNIIDFQKLEEEKKEMELEREILYKYFNPNDYYIDTNYSINSQKKFFYSENNRTYNSEFFSKKANESFRRLDDSRIISSFRISSNNNTNNNTNDNSQINISNEEEIYFKDNEKEKISSLNFKRFSSIESDNMLKKNNYSSNLNNKGNKYGSGIIRYKFSNSFMLPKKSILKSPSDSLNSSMSNSGKKKKVSFGNVQFSEI
jgi:hypothetical protein